MIDLRFVSMPRPAKGVGVKNSQFRAKYLATLDMLEDELNKLGAKLITIQAGYKIADIRNDGWPRASAKPEHPACVLQFKDRKGQQLAFRASKYTAFEDNLRAIAMTLESLRAVDRYGVVEGEQYAGFKQLGDGGNASASATKTEPSRQEAAMFLAAYSSVPKDYILDSAESRDDAYRRAARVLHPDSGGSHEQFVELQRMMRVLTARAGAV